MKIYMTVATMALSLMLFTNNILAIDYVSSFGGTINGCTVDKGQAYISQRNSIEIFDIKDSKRIHKIGSYHIEGVQIEKLGIRWPILYCTVSQSCSHAQYLMAMDVSDPANPRELPERFDSLSSHHGLSWVISGSWLIAWAGGDPFLYDISDPSNPHKRDIDSSGLNLEDMERNTFDTTASIATLPPIPQELLYAGSVRNVLADGNHVYVMDNGKKLSTIDVTNSLEPRYVGVPQNEEKIRRQMDAEELGRAAIKDKRTLKDQVIRLNATYEIRVAYKTEETTNTIFSGEKILLNNLTDPMHPKQIKELMAIDHSGNDRLEGLWVSGNWLFLISSFHNTAVKSFVLSLYDLTNPEKPLFMGSFPKDITSDQRYDQIHRGLEQYPGGIAVNGNMVYVADNESGLVILRIASKDEDLF